jgi:hypothetical protein
MYWNDCRIDVLTSLPGDIVDQVSEVDRRISKLKEKREELRDCLIGMGPGVYPGEWFDAIVATTTRNTLNMKAVREKLSRQFVKSHTSITTYPTVVIRKNKNTDEKVA